MADPVNIESKYMNGDCYPFAKALVKKFQGTLYYLPIDNHFVAYIDGHFFDIRGLLTEDQVSPNFTWSEYQLIEPLDAERTEYYCIRGKKIQSFENLKIF